MAKRIYYSKNFKRQALISVANGANFEDILRSGGFDIDCAIKKDKKYCAKLLHKWRKELYKNNELICFTGDNITFSMLENELERLNNLNEDDEIMSDMKNKIAQGVNKYNRLKEHIISKYHYKNNKY